MNYLGYLVKFEQYPEHRRNEDKSEEENHAERINEIGDSSVCR